MYAVYSALMGGEAHETHDIAFHIAIHQLARRVRNLAAGWILEQVVLQLRLR